MMAKSSLNGRTDPRVASSGARVVGLLLKPLTAKQMGWAESVDQSFLETVAVSENVLHGIFAKIDHTVEKEGSTVYECKVGVSEFPNAGTCRLHYTTHGNNARFYKITIQAGPSIRGTQRLGSSGQSWKMRWRCCIVEQLTLSCLKVSKRDPLQGHSQLPELPRKHMFSSNSQSVVGRSNLPACLPACLPRWGPPRGGFPIPAHC